VVMKGPGLIVEFMNPVGASVLGVADGQHRPFEEVLARDSVLIDGVRGAFRDDKVWSSGPRAATLKKGNQTAQRALVFTAVPTHEDGKVDGIVLYGEDVTGMPERGMQPS